MSKIPFVLVTGGLGFIGSHTTITLLEKGYNVLIIDNLCNTSQTNVAGLKTLYQNLNNFTQLRIEEFDLRDKENLDRVFSYYNIHSVIHFAALKSVSESIEKPLLYYDNNITGTLNLLQNVIEHKVKNFIFSSSATVYGSSEPPFEELRSQTGIGITNPYGRTKMMIEEILTDIHKSSNLNVICLRYFNPIGAHPSGLIGEVPNGVPNNLFPYILDVAEGKREILSVYGGDWNTYDGTCLRDYIHVMDLADGHYEALRFMDSDSFESKFKSKIFEVINLGTGKPTSVLELIHSFEDENKIKINYKVIERRKGDVESSFAMIIKARDMLKWGASRTIEDMCRDGWNFRKKN